MNQSGGVQGGASAFSGLSDVAISSPSTGQVPVYNSGTSKWENGDVSATDTSGANLSLLTPVTTGGTSSAYTLTDTRVGSPADGQVFGCLIHTDCTSFPQLNVNGSGARYIAKYDGFGSATGMGTAQLKARSFVILKYDSTLNYYFCLSVFPLATSDIPGGLIGGKILATIDTSGTGTVTGSSYTTLKFTTSTNTIATAGSGYYTATKAGLISYELRVVLAASRDVEIRSVLNGANDFTTRETDTEFVVTGLMPIAIGEYFEFLVYNYGSDTTVSSGRLRVALLSI